MTRRRRPSLPQAYRELPWRRKARWLAGALAVVVAVLAVLLLEVHFSAQAIVLGYQLRRVERRTVRQRQENAELKTRLARLTSGEMVWKRARQAYRLPEPDEVHFVPVPAAAVATPSPMTMAVPQVSAEPPLPTAYRESLLHWLMRYLLPEEQP